MDLDNELKELLDRDFYNIYDIVYEKLCDDEKFCKIRNNINKILDKYPKVNDVCLEEKNYILDESEIDGLIKYLKYKKEENELYEEKLLYTGVRLAYIIFKKADMLKEE